MCGVLGGQVGEESGEEAAREHLGVEHVGQPPLELRQAATGAGGQPPGSGRVRSDVSVDRLGDSVSDVPLRRP